MRLRLDQNYERNKKAGEAGKKLAEEIRLTKKNLSLGLTHIEKNLCGCLKILIFFMIKGKIMHQTLKFSKVYDYKV